MLHQPAESPLDHPAFRLGLEPLGGGPFDDPDVDSSRGSVLKTLVWYPPSAHTFGTLRCEAAGSSIRRASHAT
ncbi:hypothetical protein ACFQ0X_07460 [Streptomyces rectiviolaceus]|uniref:Uncharacterized protein n=1 Tax=Streptomyces rectiviolaceus TaxID=332591 RepID=A0ABP6MDB2_9ACTN